jgi:hypothetical protein
MSRDLTDLAREIDEVGAEPKMTTTSVTSTGKTRTGEARFFQFHDRC